VWHCVAGFFWGVVVTVCFVLRERVPLEATPRRHSKVRIVYAENGLMCCFEFCNTNTHSLSLTLSHIHSPHTHTRLPHYTCSFSFTGTNYKNTVEYFKRYLGRASTDPELSHEAPWRKCGYTSVAEKPAFVVNHVSYALSLSLTCTLFLSSLRRCIVSSLLFSHDKSLFLSFPLPSYRLAKRRPYRPRR
jgi:hypothetical protein